MRLLFHHNVPAPLRRLLIRHEISLAAELGWHEMVNGELLAAAERVGFDVLLTADPNIRYQQNLANQEDRPGGTVFECLAASGAARGQDRWGDRACREG